MNPTGIEAAARAIYGDWSFEIADQTDAETKARKAEDEADGHFDYGPYISRDVMLQTASRALAAAAALPADVAGLVERLQDRVGSTFDNEATFDAVEVEGIVQSITSLSARAEVAEAALATAREALERAVAILDGELGSGWGDRNQADWMMIDAARKDSTP